MKLPWKTLNDLSKSYGDSFYLMDLERFQENYLRFLNAFQNSYAKSQIAYSYKTNYTPRLCQRVQQMGGYAEVVSGMEYELALRIGVSAERIIFNGPYKQAIDFDRALLNGSMVNLDSHYEVQLLCALSKRFPDKPFRIGLRCNFPLGTEPLSRFGFDVASQDFQSSLQSLRALPNCHIVGLHCHFLAPERSAQAYADIGQHMITLAQTEFANEPLEFIDLGGGFFSPMSPDLQKQFPYPIPSFAEYGHTIASVFQAAFPDENGPELILEPGISLTADTMKFITKVIDLKTIGARSIALVAGSRYDIKPTLSPRNLPISIAPAPSGQASQHRFDIVGSTCMENDCLHKGYQGALKAGDYVIFDNVGAYTNVLRPPFINPASPILSHTTAGDIEVLRRRETLEDIFSSYTF